MIEESSYDFGYNEGYAEGWAEAHKEFLKMLPRDHPLYIKIKKVL